MNYSMNVSLEYSGKDYYDYYHFDMDEFMEAVEDMKRLDAITRVITPVIMGVLLTIGFIGNTLVIWTSISTQRIVKHPVHSMLVLNLAVADLVYLLSSAPYQILVFSVPGWQYGPHFCSLLHFLNIQTMAVSIFTMCSLAVMRFMTLLMPFKMQNIISPSGKIAGCCIIMIVWVLGSVIAAPAGIFYRTIVMYTPETLEKGEVATECVWAVTDNQLELVYGIVLLFFTYAIPLFLVASLYFFIRRILCDKSRRLRVPQRKQSLKERKGRCEERTEYIRTTVMIFCLIVAFLICWFPYHLYKIITVLPKYMDHSFAKMRVIMEMVGLYCSYAHACVNPVIYTFAAPGWGRGICSASKHHRNKSDLRFHSSCKYCHNRGKYTLTNEKQENENSRMLTPTNQEKASTSLSTNLASRNSTRSANDAIIVVPRNGIIE